MFCDIIQQETSEQNGRRVVLTSDRFVVIEPFAPRFPFETWILPLGHSDSFQAMSDSTELQEFANTTFIENHCFHLAGRDTIAGETLVRVDFEPAERLAWADIAGAAYLDSLTYELRFTETSLTHPERSPLTEVNTMTARTRFHSIAPGIPLQDSLIAITTYRFGRFTKRIETQRLIDMRFRRRAPTQDLR